MKKPCSNCKDSRIEQRHKTFVFVPGKYECANCQKYIDYIQWRKSKQKYTMGKTICSIKEFDEHIRDGFMYLNGKVKHISWLTSMTYRTLDRAIKFGRVHVAIKKD